MEQREKDHILQSLEGLITNITLNVALKAHLESRKALSKYDLEDIGAVPTHSGKVRKLLDFMEKKTDGYTILTTALDYTLQSGAVTILKAIPGGVAAKPPNELAAAVGTVGISHSKYRLKFGTNVSIINDVLPILKPRFTQAMGNSNVNQQILMELGSLLLFDHTELESVQKLPCTLEQQRINALFDVVKCLDPDEIIKCLEKLCDLPHLPRKSERFCNIISECFPGVLSELGA